MPKYEKWNTVFDIAQARINDFEIKFATCIVDEPLDVRFARALLDLYVHFTATQKLLTDKIEEFDQLDEQCLAFIGEMMRQDRIIKVIEPIAWIAVSE